MFNKIIFMSNMLILLSAHVTFASTERVVSFQALPSTYTPSIKIENVYGSLSNVTAVKMRIKGLDLEFSLQNTGSRVWEVKLSPEQVKLLLGDQSSKTYETQLIIYSKNAKNRTESRIDLIQLNIRS